MILLIAYLLGMLALGITVATFCKISFVILALVLAFAIILLIANADIAAEGGIAFFFAVVGLVFFVSPLIVYTVYFVIQNNLHGISAFFRENILR